MKKNLTTLLLLAGTLFSAVLLAPATALAQDAEADKYSMSVSLNSDVFFGFYPFFQGAYKLSDKMAFTFYGIQWSGGTGAGWGNWTEFGAGVNYQVTPELSVNPQIGLLNGSLTSGLGAPFLGEGIVPNLTARYITPKIESEFYAGLYTGLDRGNVNTNNYLHYWLNGGYKISKFISAGLHLEHLRFTGGKGYADDAAYDYYLSFGPYVQLSDPAGQSFVRFSTGADLRSDEEIAKAGNRQPQFFKLSLGFNL